MPKKYFIASDWHLELLQGYEKVLWSRLQTSYEDTPTAIVAGDFTSFGLPDRIVWDHFTGLCRRFVKVIYVPGNHEYYGTDPESMARRLALLEEAFGGTLKVLRAGESYTYDGQRFIGDTMWFPDRPEVHIYRRLISDTFQIKGLLPWAFTQSALLLNYLKSSVQPDDIVVTHHVPTDYDTLRHWKNSPTQAYFLNSQCELYLQNPNFMKPKAWIYGHTHDRHDYNVYGTRFICNPVGYMNEGRQWNALNNAVYEIGELNAGVHIQV